MRFAQRHAAYTTMLEHLVLLDQHRENLLERGLSEERIQQNQYRSMPETEQGRRLLGRPPPLPGGQELQGLPGFRTRYGEWTLSGPKGFLIPVRDRDGLIQGSKSVWTTPASRTESTAGCPHGAPPTEPGAIPGSM